MVYSDINKIGIKTFLGLPSSPLAGGEQSRWNIKPGESDITRVQPLVHHLLVVWPYEVNINSLSFHYFSYSKEMTSTLPQCSAPSGTVMRARDYVPKERSL